MTVTAGDSDGAVEQARTAEPLPYQGSALPTELQQHIFCRSVIIAQTFLVCKAFFRLSLQILQYFFLDPLQGIVDGFG